MLEKFKGQLIVSCQALAHEPLHSPFIMGRMALAAAEAGAVGIRAQGVEDIIEIKKVTNLPVIGLIKRNYEDSDIYITPTTQEVRELLQTSCEIIAVDATLRRRPHDEKLSDLVNLIHEHGCLALADISNDEEGLYAQEIGFDCVSTTLSGYTPYTPKFSGPDLGLVTRMVDKLDVPVFAEGRINTPEDLKQVYEVGAYGAIVGSAITRPQLIAKTFVDILKK